MATISLTPGNRYKARVRTRGVSMSKTFSTRKAAKVWAARVERELEENKAHGYAYASLRRLTLGEVALGYLQHWEEQRRKDVSRPARVRWWIDKLGHVPVLDVDKVHVREALRDYGQQNAIRMTRDGKALDRGHKVSGASVNRMQAALSAVFQWARQELDVPSNPCHEVTGRRESKGMERFLTEAEANRLLQAARDSTYDKLHLFIAMGLNTGARKGELLGLRWTDIDWQNCTATLAQGRTKTEKPRILPLHPKVMAELAKHRPGSGKVVDLAAQRLEGRTLIFRGFKHPMVPAAVYPLFQAAVKKANLAPLRIHDLRHSAISLAAQRGASSMELAEMAGHSSLATTKRYSHFTVDSKRRLTDEMFSGVLEGSNDE